MGCLKSKEKEEPEAPVQELTTGPVKTIDPRLPFDNYRQLFNLKNSWKAVTRSLTKTAKECLIRYFRKHPEHLAWHRGLANMDDEEKMRASTTFENVALSVFNTFDDFMENVDKLDIALATLNMAAKPHEKIKGFRTQFFKDMEGPFMESVAEALGDRWTDPTEQNFRKLYTFVVQQMTEALGGETPEEPAAENETKPEEEVKEEDTEEKKDEEKKEEDESKTLNNDDAIADADEVEVTVPSEQLESPTAGDTTITGDKEELLDNRV